MRPSSCIALILFGSACRTTETPAPGLPPPSDEVSKRELDLSRAESPVATAHDHRAIDRGQSRAAGVESSYTDVIPTSAQLALELPGPNDPEQIPADRIADARVVLGQSFRTLSEAISPIHERMESLIRFGAWTTSGECRVSDHETHRLRICEDDAAALRYTVTLFRGENVILSGEGATPRGRSGVLVGNLRYELDADEGPSSGSVTIEFRIAGNDRTLDVTLDEFAPTKEQLAVSAQWEYESILVTGGRARVSTVADLLMRTGPNLQRGRDSEVELAGSARGGGKTAWDAHSR